MKYLTQIVLMMSTTSAFIILLLTTTGLRSKMAERAPRLIHKMLNCDFCISFWVNFMIAAIIAVLSGDIEALLLPIITAPITRLVV